ncbi:hypothetical protein BGW80DRAFT_305822 [Lactifluus volemus]|nr:hypothetical protein BGW80DRAFT_305822 [Lactifluus volemus]
MESRGLEGNEKSSKSPRSVSPPTYVNHDEKARGPESTTVVVTTPTLEASLIQATSKIDALVMVVSDQNQKIGKLGQDNADLRNEIRNLSQTFQKSKRDLQMFEITINKITCELRTKFEKMFDKSQTEFKNLLIVSWRNWIECMHHLSMYLAFPHSSQIRRLWLNPWQRRTVVGASRRLHPGQFQQAALSRRL